MASSTTNTTDVDSAQLLFGVNASAISATVISDCHSYTKVKIDDPKPLILAAEEGEQDSSIKEVKGEKKDGGNFQSIILKLL